jgi:hypothetical protein
MGFDMSRVIAVAACGFSLAACSATMPSLNFGSSSPPTEAVRFESEPPGAEVKTTLGQSCRTPCELTLQAGAELSGTFTLKDFQPQTVAIRPEAIAGSDTPRLSPNPVYVELKKASALTPPKKKKKPPAVARVKPAAPVTASAATAPSTAEPPPMPSSPPPEAAASATNYPWPSR